ncbi:MAG TPA: glycosyltransferase family 1 protein [Candidatus Eremiobacteraceae bacterium]|nr:glycosyltransferase family 1 protein [Candidatus Eremiobacteraceae bacterium]
MKVLIDFTQIPTDRTGVGVYADKLISGLSSLVTNGDSLLVLVQKDERGIYELVRDSPNVSIASVPTTVLRNRALLFLYEQVVLPVLLVSKNVDVIHSLHYTHPLICPCSRVVTVHDLTFLLSPELHTWGRRLIMPFFIKHAVRRSEAVVFISNTTRVDSEKLIQGAKKKLRRVIPLGVSLKEFNLDSQLVEEVLAKFLLTQPYVLYLGTIEPRKNIFRLIQAYEQIAHQHPNLLLVLAGKSGWHVDNVFAAIRSSKYRERIRHLGFVSELEKRALLTKCQILVYPSLYEGFGLPVLEAMAAGAPVITSNVSALPEVTGDAAILINPLSVEEIATAMSMLLNDEQKRDHLRILGKRRAAEFSWEKVAIQTFDLYKEVAEK